MRSEALVPSHSFLASLRSELVYPSKDPASARAAAVPRRGRRRPNPNSRPRSRRDIAPRTGPGSRPASPRVDCEPLHELPPRRAARAVPTRWARERSGRRSWYWRSIACRRASPWDERVSLLKALNDTEFGHPVDPVGDRVGVVAHAVEHLAPLGEEPGDLLGRGHGVGALSLDVVVGEVPELVLEVPRRSLAVVLTEHGALQRSGRGRSPAPRPRGGAASPERPRDRSPRGPRARARSSRA